MPMDQVCARGATYAFWSTNAMVLVDRPRFLVAGQMRGSVTATLCPPPHPQAIRDSSFSAIVALFTLVLSSHDKDESYWEGKATVFDSVPVLKEFLS